MKMTNATQKRVLVVDDEATIRELLSEILSRAGCIVDMAENGRHALKMLRRGDPPGRPYYDLIVSDVNMPEMDGISFYRALSENLPEMKGRVLFVTGNSTREVISFFKEHGCKYIEKPNLFGESGLLYQINNILSR